MFIANCCKLPANCPQIARKLPKLRLTQVLQTPIFACNNIAKKKFPNKGGYVIMGVYRTLGASRVKALLLLLLAPIISFRGHPLCPISMFSSILVKST